MCADSRWCLPAFFWFFKMFRNNGFRSEDKSGELMKLKFLEGVFKNEKSIVGILDHYPANGPYYCTIGSVSVRTIK